MSRAPRLTVGLPVYNGAALLAQSIEALLRQTYEDFELVISDNASTDGTADICRFYETQDARVRYIRQPRNLGSAGNHNFVAAQASGEFFKFASHDDLYGRELLTRCVEALDEHPDVVLAHSWTAMIDGSDTVTLALEYPLETSSPLAPERFHSALFGRGGDDFYGVMRRTALPGLHLGSHYRADRTLIGGLSLFGPFYQVPEWLYFRREHAERNLRPQGAGEEATGWPERDWPLGRAFCVTMDPRRANRLRHPALRLYGEYVWAYIAAIRSAPLTAADRSKCYRCLAQWVAHRTRLARTQHPESRPRPAPGPLSVDELVARREKRAS